MYNERKDNFSVKDIVLQVLFVVLFIFILMWLFPSKQFVKDSLEPLYDRIFNENILMMKDSAKSYYTTPRLPQKVGDKVEMTLGEMLNKKIILPFKDSKGRSCDNTESFVQITKMDEEYIMKVNLKCTEQENYLLVYMGCYDYCKTTICEKNVEDVKKPAILPTKVKPTSTPTDPAKPTPPPIAKEYICKYVKTVDATYTEWGNWSDWSTNVVYKNDLTQVQDKDEVSYTYDEIQIGTKVITKTITYADKNKPIYGDKQIQIGTENKNVCTATTDQKVGTGEYVYTEWQDTNVSREFTTEPPLSGVERWYFVREIDQVCNCAFGKVRIYAQQTRSQYEKTVIKTVCTKWEMKETPVYTTVKVVVGYGTSQRVEKQTVPIYGTIKTPHYTKNYRYRTRTLNGGYRDELWSKCDDSNLVAKGYKWTGEKKEK